MDIMQREIDTFAEMPMDTGMEVVFTGTYLVLKSFKTGCE